MLREAIAQGETVEIAFTKACEELGVETMDAEFEILETPTKKTFGLFGGNPAKVRAYISENTPPQEAAEYLKRILAEMGFKDVQIDIKDEEAGALLTISGEDIGFIIGHRGETLDALQYLVSLVANHVENSYYRITLDVGNYREKRKATLEALGRKMASRALKTGRNSSLEPMNPYERRIIHTVVQDVEGVKSWSEGANIFRYVVIGPVDGEKFQRRDSRNDNRRGNSSGRGNYDRKPREFKSRTSNLSQKPSDTPKSDAPDTPIYGKIEIKK